MVEPKKAETKSADKSDARIAKLEAEIERLKVIMRRNGWTLED